jgi:hypothetical protein
MSATNKRVCVYCLSAIPDELFTEDHVIARSWYPSNTPSLPKWKVPACFPCNKSLSRIEEETLRRLAMCANVRDKTLTKIIATAKRSVNPAYGKNPKDKAMREKRRQALIRDLMHDVSPQMPGMLPAFQRNFDEGSNTGIKLDANELEAIGTKWIRGLHYWRLGDLIPPTAAIDIHFVTDEVAQMAFAEILKFATAVHNGPGVQALIFDAVEGNRRITQYAFKIWSEFKLYGTVEIEF